MLPEGPVSSGASVLGASPGLESQARLRTGSRAPEPDHDRLGSSREATADCPCFARNQWLLKPTTLLDASLCARKGEVISHPTQMLPVPPGERR